jgi:parallel beta-helix repeat protein
MDGKLPEASMLFFVLLSLLVLSVKIETSEALTCLTIYIRADGSIDPPTQFVQRYGDLYVLTWNIESISDGIVVERSDIVLDGAGYSLQGTGIGFNLTRVKGVVIRNVNLKSFGCGIVIRNSSDNNVTGNGITTSSYSILLYCSSNNSISGNNIANNSCGIFLDTSSNNNISGNVIVNNYCGIQLACSSNNVISQNNIASSKGVGIGLGTCSENHMVRNKIGNNNYGFSLVISSNNSIIENDIARNQCGVSLDDSSYNEVYHNNITDNTCQVSSDSSPNKWDDGSKGNYWNDYARRYPNAHEIDASGVWDTPYVVDMDYTDRYPLVNPVPSIPEFPSFIALPLFMSTTLLAILLRRRKHKKIEWEIVPQILRILQFQRVA